MCLVPRVHAEVLIFRWARDPYGYGFAETVGKVSTPNSLYVAMDCIHKRIISSEGISSFCNFDVVGRVIERNGADAICYVRDDPHISLNGPFLNLFNFYVYSILQQEWLLFS